MAFPRKKWRHFLSTIGDTLVKKSKFSRKTRWYDDVYCLRKSLVRRLLPTQNFLTHQAKWEPYCFNLIFQPNGAMPTVRQQHVKRSFIFFCQMTSLLIFSSNQTISVTIGRILEKLPIDKLLQWPPKNMKPFGKCFISEGLVVVFVVFCAQAGLAMLWNVRNIKKF